MDKALLIGVDVGVSFVKAGIYDTNGTCIASVSNPSPGEYPKPGVFIQKNSDYLKVITTCLTEVIQKAQIEGSCVEAVAFSSAMGGATGIDKDGNVVFDWSIVSDTRFSPYVKEAQQRAGIRILQLSGTNFPMFGPKLLWWKQEYPEQYKKVKKFLFLSGYIVGELCDIPVTEAFVDQTFLPFTGIADISSAAWSDELCDSLGIDTGLLPRIVESSSIVGRLSEKYARITGLKTGTPFAAGSGDKPAGCLGAGMVEPGILVEESASFGALSLCVDQFIPDESCQTLENIPAPVGRLFYPGFYLFGSGVTHAWFKDNFGDKGASFEDLDRKAAALPPGSDGLLALGLLGGRGYPSDPDVRGMWLGHTWSHRKEHFYRALLESFAYEYGFVLSVMRKTYPGLAMEEIRVIGGGAKSDLWNQIKCDVMGVPYVKLNRDDVALLGDILLAGSGVGIFKDVKKHAPEFITITDRFEPDPDKTAYYSQYQSLYESLFDNLREIFVNLKNIPEFT